MDWSVSSAVLITDGVAAIVGWAALGFTRGSLFVARCASTATTASTSARGWPTASTDGSGKHRLCCPDGCQPHNPNQLQPAARGSSVLSRVRGRILDECFPCFCHAAFSFTSSQGRHRHRSVCADTEAVAAATRRICAAFWRGARISINSCAHGSSTTKAIIAAPPLSGRTGDGASRRDSRKSLPVVRYRNASWR